MNDAVVMLIASTVVGIIQAIFWRWVSAISDASQKTANKLDTVQLQVAALQSEMYRDYQSKMEAHKDNDRIMASLQKIEADVAKISDKLDKKADK